MLIYQWPSMVEYRAIKVQELEDQLVSLDTHTYLVTLICLSANTMGKSVLLDVAGHPKVLSLRILLTEQNKIGLLFLFMGFWSRDWRKIQEVHLHNLRKFKNIDSWVGQAQLEVWNYAQLL